MKVLFVAPYLPSPPRFGGQRRLDGLMRGLTERHEVSVLAFNKLDPYAEMSLEATRRFCHHVATVPEVDLESVGKTKRWLQARSLISRNSYEGMLVRKRRNFQEHLHKMLSDNHYDVVQIEFAQMGAYDFAWKGWNSPLLVLDEHNIEYDLARRSAETSESVARRVYNAMNWRKLRVEERRVWSKCDGIVVTSPRDNDLVVDGTRRLSTAVVPNGVDVEAFQPASSEPDPDRILFFGAINYFPNQDGVVHFIDHTLPLILAKRPQAKLWIVGPGARKPVVDRQTASIVITGFVDDLNEHLDKAAVVVVPLRIGGGTRLKIVEAMAKGKAIVSTRIGAEGLDIVHGTHALLADTPEEFAAHVETLLADPALAQRIGAAARELAVERYSWTAVVKTLEEFYIRLRDEREQRATRRA